MTGNHNSWSYQYLPSTEGTEYDSPFPMLFGVIHDAGIDGVSVVSQTTGEEFAARIVNGHGVKLWYLLLDKEQGVTFKMSAYSKQVHSVQNIDGDRAFQGDAGTKRQENDE